MKTYTKRILAAYLASAAISISAGSAMASEEISEEIPVQLIDDVLFDVTQEEWNSDKREAILNVAVDDCRAEIRVRACELLAAQSKSHSWDTLAPLMETLAADNEPRVRNEIALTVAQALENESPMVRTEVASTWALSKSDSTRITIARVLSHKFYCLGAPTVATHLSKDPNHLVRRAVVDIASSRKNENPAIYNKILETLSLDPNRQIRKSARKSLSKA